jgi:hypothetical protein
LAFAILLLSVSTDGLSEYLLRSIYIDACVTVKRQLGTAGQNAVAENAVIDITFEPSDAAHIS